MKEKVCNIYLRPEHSLDKILEDSYFPEYMGDIGRCIDNDMLLILAKDKICLAEITNAKKPKFSIIEICLYKPHKLINKIIEIYSNNNLSKMKSIMNLLCGAIIGAILGRLF